MKAGDHDLIVGINHLTGSAFVNRASASCSETVFGVCATYEMRPSRIPTSPWNPGLPGAIDDMSVGDEEIKHCLPRFDKEDDEVHDACRNQQQPAGDQHVAEVR
jgi:hypothetical protein